MHWVWCVNIFLFCEIYFFECSRGNKPVCCWWCLAASLCIWCEAHTGSIGINAAHSLFPLRIQKTLTVIKNNSRNFYALYFPLTPPEMEIYTIYVHCKLLKRRWVWKFYARERIINSTQWIWREGGRHKSKRLFLGMPRERHYHSFYAPKNV